MKTLLSLVVCASLSVALFAQPESKGHISRERALARLTKLFSDSEVVVLARVSQEGNRLVFSCKEIWKAKNGSPTVGQVIEIDSKQKLEHQEGDAIVYLPAFPAEKGWYEALWLSKEKLSSCPDLSVAEIRDALPINKG